MVQSDLIRTSASIHPSIHPSIRMLGHSSNPVSVNQPQVNSLFHLLFFLFFLFLGIGGGGGRRGGRADAAYCFGVVVTPPPQVTWPPPPSVPPPRPPPLPPPPSFYSIFFFIVSFFSWSSMDRNVASITATFRTQFTRFQSPTMKCLQSQRFRLGSRLSSRLTRLLPWLLSSLTNI